MSGKQRKTRQIELAFPELSEGEAPRRTGVGDEPLVVKGETNSPVDTTEIMEEICRQENVERAAKRVRKNKGAPGVDGMTVKELPRYLERRWPEIRSRLCKGTYEPKAVRHVEILKPGGGIRTLGIPCVVDRVIQQAILQVLQPKWDRTFSEHSYGFRPGRSAHQAVSQAHQYVSEGYEYVVDLDLEKFFDKVNHDMLMARIAKRVTDKRLLRLIRAYLNAGIMKEGLTASGKNEGMPQGGPLSPLLSNLFLDDLDHELERRGHRFVRYADDCNIYVRTERAGKRVMENITRYISKKLKLRVNKEKSAVDKVARRKFLGFSVVWSRTTKPLRSISTPSIKKFKDKIRRQTRRICGQSIKQLINDLSPIIRGWRNYYGFCQTPWVLKDLDGWIRRRLRNVIWAQWKTYRRRRDALKRLGVKPYTAVQTAWKGCESNGSWAMSRDPRVQKALSPKHFNELSLPTLYMS